ncbi:coiled-coil domain-containing protein [Streptomyces sp. NPDC012637]|uniref:coiled-coil domain-containing protein n=1 Tax=Streptomyces sp. NPDC012637 TaxID=3364842 RepID=UPI0036EC29FF
MPRGRHRHSPPLHKLLPPSAVAGASVVCAAGAWLFGDPVVLRLLVAAAAAAAVTGAVLMRSWDREAGRQVAELTRARTADQWKHEERIAELESDLEESRELRTRLDAKLRAKRVELAGLRSEHADLLRRYATAETERASALEGRRVLALESSATTQAKALPPAGSTPTPEAYRRAAEALRKLASRSEPDPDPETTREPLDGPEATAGTEAAPEPVPVPTAETAGDNARDGHDAHDAHTKAPAMRHVPAAAAIVPYATRRPVPRPSGGFDYFGTLGAKKAAAAIEAVQNTDLADVVGEEVLASAVARPAEQRAIGQVIDLTAHDETEQLDVAELRGAVNS